MDEFKPDNQPNTQNDLRPDTSDRPAGRSRPSSTAKPKLTISRQHIMIGVGVLVLLLLIIAISSALKAPTEHEKQQTDTTANERNIDLSSSSSLSNNQSPSGQAQEINVPPVNPVPTQGTQQQQTNNYGERIEIPGDVVDALNQGQSLNQGTANTPAQNIAPPPVTQTPPAQKPQTVPAKPERTQTKPVETKQPTQPKQSAKTTTANQNQSGNLMSAPASNYTLQLSSASRSDTLEAFAKQHKLNNYKVYKTIRNGQTWYVLIHGNYRSVNEAKSAIATLPAEIQAKKPWVRNMKQVQQDQK
ncbi:SPOR domain-containing protein [Providencia sp. PROV119]|uniref:SPOR domain-containing protein n=1 Tax=Providencia sp. PROV119 TaxID=2949830 RepID=UPI00234A38E2|nr:SPOR domain-containing protein [Providencia sp. PROV119]